MITQPPALGISQTLNTFLVALLSFTTSIFLFARNLAPNSNELAGVDATQASEVIFALLGGIVFLGEMVPNIVSIIGLVLILVGLLLFVTYLKV